MRAAKALASLVMCADLPEPSMVTDAISTEISCAVTNLNKSEDEMTPAIFIFVPNDRF